MEEVYLSKNIENLLNKIDYSKLGKNVAIKVHFGEEGCVTYMSPAVVKKVYDKIVSLGKKATLVECNVLYRGLRTNSSSHTKLAKAHGFDFAPIDILDGENGERFVEVKVGGVAKVAKIGEGIKKYDSMLVLSHFKGHGFAGFGGALKNIGMGLGSRAGKLHMHASVHPVINEKNCTGCQTCIQNCGSNAICLVNGKAKIDSKKCTGCAMCIAVCPNESVNIPWGSQTAEELQKKIVDYAEGVIKLMKNKIIYINILQNITEECDCMSNEQKPMMKDIGFLAGEDIVAVDRASMDLADKFSEGKFTKINGVNKNIQIDYAETRQLGSKKYKIVELD